jgi:DNA-binding protein HU-beta
MAKNTATAKLVSAPAPKAAAKPALQKPVTLKHLASDIADKRGVSKREIEDVLTETIALIGKNLKKGNKIRLVGLGILQVRKRAARMGRNPQTGEAIKIKASKKIAFRAAKELKEAV